MSKELGGFKEFRGLVEYKDFKVFKDPQMDPKVFKEFKEFKVLIMAPKVLKEL